MLALRNRGGSHGVHGKDDDEGADTAHGHQQGDQQAGQGGPAYAEELEQGACHRLGRAGDLHKLTVGSGQTKQQEVAAYKGHHGTGVRAGEGSPEGEQVGDDNNHRGDHRGHKRVDALVAQYDQTCNGQQKANHADSAAHRNSSLSHTDIGPARPEPPARLSPPVPPWADEIKDAGRMPPDLDIFSAIHTLPQGGAKGNRCQSGVNDNPLEQFVTGLSTGGRLIRTGIFLTEKPWGLKID